MQVICIPDPVIDETGSANYENVTGIYWWYVNNGWSDFKLHRSREIAWNIYSFIISVMTVWQGKV